MCVSSHISFTHKHTHTHTHSRVQGIHTLLFFNLYLSVSFCSSDCLSEIESLPLSFPPPPSLFLVFICLSIYLYLWYPTDLELKLFAWLELFEGTHVSRRLLTLLIILGLIMNAHAIETNGYLTFNVLIVPSSLHVSFHFSL